MTIRELQATTSPHPFGLVTSLKEDGRTNLMALSWWTFVSNTPPLLAIAVSNRGYTGTCIRRTGEFGLCLVGEGLNDRALRCGACSGRDRGSGRDGGARRGRGGRRCGGCRRYGGSRRRQDR